MKESSGMKKALGISLIAILLCLSMFLGTTFAWFTDSVTSAGNKIIAGNLDIELYLNTDANTKIAISENPDPIFGTGAIAQNDASETLWEPGKTQVVYLTIENKGNLDLKYRVDVVATSNSTPSLTEVLKYAIIRDATYGTVDSWKGGLSIVDGVNPTEADGVFLKAGDSYNFALAIHMDEAAGNEYMNGDISFDIVVLASQVASEKDSFDEHYDETAPYEETTNP